MRDILVFYSRQRQLIERIVTYVSLLVTVNQMLHDLQ